MMKVAYFVLNEQFREQPCFTCTEHVRVLPAKGLGNADVSGQCGSAILGGGIASYGDTCYLRVRDVYRPEHRMQPSA